jgi:NhaP-type Na+/H+ or K+/H+ antiporter
MNVTTLALIGVVILVAALLSGLVERTRFPQVALFLLLGLLIGPAGLRLVQFGLHSQILQTIATLGLVLVLFTDAVGVNFTEVKRNRTLIRLVLGPGTLLTAAIIALAAWLFLKFSLPFAAILGAALASTDPVMMRGLLRGAPDVPTEARHVLALESGLNDLVLLPIVLVGMEVITRTANASDWAPAAIRLFLLGPAAGVVIGFAGVAVLERVRRWMGVRRDYESLYALGLAFTSYGAAEALHGSGFLAAFAAGLTIAGSDAELCDCFLDLGQAGAEMFLLFTFVAFGSSMIWTGLSGIGLWSIVFAIVALGARSAVLAVLLPRRMDARSRRLIIWFGPRALSTLLLVLLPIFAGLLNAEQLFAPAAFVVLLSIVVHGGALMVFEKKHPTPKGDAPPLDVSQIGRTPERITLEEVKALQARGERVIILDVRKDNSWNESDQQASGAIRLSPDTAIRRAAELALPRNDWLVAYCT